METGENCLKGFVAGGFGGACLVVVGHPLDTIKVRLQAMPVTKPGEKPMYTGTYDCAKKILLKEGPTGFYKGMTAPLLTVAPIFAVSFFGFHLGKSLQNFPGGDNCYLCMIRAGMLAGASTTLIATPTDRIKCLLQVQQHSGRYSSALDCIYKLYKEGGIRSVYKGTCATMLRNIPAGAAFFTSYEWTQNVLTPEGETREALSPVRTVVAGGAAGIMHWLVIMPADVIRTRVQCATGGQYPKGVRSVFVELMKEEGPSAFYRGFTTVLIRAFPANGACFLGYEVAVRFIDWLQGK